jgi:hypothetical protein
MDSTALRRKSWTLKLTYTSKQSAFVPITFSWSAALRTETILPIGSKPNRSYVPREDFESARNLQEASVLRRGLARLPA